MENQNVFVRNAVITVGTTAILVSNARERVMLYLRNASTGGQSITVVFGEQTVASGAGIVLAPNDFMTESDSGDYQCWRGQISGIASGAGGSLVVVER